MSMTNHYVTCMYEAWHLKVLPPIISNSTDQLKVIHYIQFECLQIPSKSDFKCLPHYIGFVFCVFPGTLRELPGILREFPEILWGGADRVRLFVFILFVLGWVFVRIHILFMYYLYFSCLAHAIVGTCFVYALYELLRPWRPLSNIVVG